MPFFGGSGAYIIVGTNIKGGVDAAPAVTGSNNMALGNGALQSLIGGWSNVAIGNNSLSKITAGVYNVEIGTVDPLNIQISDINGSVLAGPNIGVLGALGDLGQSFDSSVIIGGNSVPFADTGNPDHFWDSVSIGVGCYSGGIAADIDRAVCIGNAALAESDAVAVGAGSNAGLNSIGIGSGVTAPANSIVIGDGTQTQVTIGGIDVSALASGVLPVATFATLPAAAGNTGKIYFVSDIGVNGSYWYSSGARWVLLNHTAALKADKNTYTTSVTAPEQITVQYTFPAGFFKPGDIFRVANLIQRSDTIDICTRKIRLGTLGTIADTELNSVAQPTGANLTVAEEQYFRIDDATTIQMLGGGAQTWNSASANAQAPITISDISNPLILSVTITRGTGNGTVISQKAFNIDYISCGA